MAVFDLHSDILTDIALKREAGEMNVFDKWHYPNLKAANVRGIICVVWVEPKYKHRELERFNEIVQYAVDDFAESKHINLCRSVDEMVNADDVINVFLGIEGMGFILDAVPQFSVENVKAYLHHLHEIGFRSGILAWNEVNRLAGGTGAGYGQVSQGLTDAGRVVVKEMMDLNWIIDVSHLDEKTFWDIYHLREYPIIASHSNAYTVCPHERNLTDEQLKAIVERNGLIGLNAYADFIMFNQASVDDFIDHLAYMAEVVGIQYIALGFDFMDYLSDHDLDTNFTGVTKNLSSALDVPDLIERIKQRGFSEEAVSMVTFDNATRCINHILKG